MYVCIYLYKAVKRRRKARTTVAEHGPRVQVGIKKSSPYTFISHADSTVKWRLCPSWCHRNILRVSLDSSDRFVHERTKYVRMDGIFPTNRTRNYSWKKRLLVTPGP